MKQHPSNDWSSVHPDFDGHLEKPLLEMAVSERLDWIWQMMEFQHWLRTQVRRVDGPDAKSEPSA